MVERYAACLLSRYWSDLLSGPLDQRIDDQGVRELIRLDFRPPTLPLENNGGGVKCSDEEQLNAVFDYLYHWAYELALWIKERFYQATHVPFDCMDFAIISQPMKRGYRRVVMLALPCPSEGWSGCLIVEPDTAPPVAPRHVPVESDISLEDRYNYGLLTRPGNDEVIK